MFSCIPLAQPLKKERGRKGDFVSEGLEASALDLPENSLLRGYEPYVSSDSRLASS